MKITTERPPQWVWDKAHEIFEIDDARTFYTYGSTLHNPADISIDNSILAHEKVHEKQQNDMAPEVWWARYFVSPAFRLSQEIEAYQRQYQHYCTTHYDRNAQAKYLVDLAGICASPMYGSIISKSEAMAKIRVSPTPLPRPVSPTGEGHEGYPVKRGGDTS